MTRGVVAFHIMSSLAVCRVQLRASGTPCPCSGGMRWLWWQMVQVGTCFPLVGTSCPASRRRDKDSSLRCSALPDYLRTRNILCLATAQMQREIREFPAGSCHLLTAHRCPIHSRKSQRTNGLGKMSLMVTYAGYGICQEK